MTELSSPRLSWQNNPLLGTWMLISATAIHADGRIEPEVYGPAPIGYITYTAEGRMSVLFCRRDRPAFSQDIHSPFQNIQALPTEEVVQAFSTFNAYAGTYTIHGSTVTHHVEIASLPNRVGTDLIRTFTITGDRVTLHTPPAQINHATATFELVWERVAAL